MKTTIEDGALRAGSHAGAPLPPLYTETETQNKKMNREFEQFRSLLADNPPPLEPSASLESKHENTVIDWKHLFKDGESVVLKGVEFIYAGRGKRCLHFRRVK